MLDKAALLTPRAILSVRDVEIPNVGTVRVRALSRAEVLELNDVKPTVDDAKALLAFEAKFLALGLVDPALTEDEAMGWLQSAPHGEADPVVEAIRVLSGLEGRADKAAFRGPE